MRLIKLITNLINPINFINPTHTHHAVDKTRANF